MLEHYYELNPRVLYYFSYCLPFCPWPHPAQQIVLPALLVLVTVCPTALIVTVAASRFTIHAFGSASSNVSVADIFLIADIFPHSWCHSLGEEHHRMGCPSHITAEPCVGISGEMYIEAKLPPTPNSWKTGRLDCLFAPCCLKSPWYWVVKGSETEPILLHGEYLKSRKDTFWKDSVWNKLVTSP